MQFDKLLTRYPAFQQASQSSLERLQLLQPRRRSDLMRTVRVDADAWQGARRYADYHIRLGKIFNTELRCLQRQSCDEASYSCQYWNTTELVEALLVCV